VASRKAVDPPANRLLGLLRRAITHSFVHIFGGALEYRQPLYDAGRPSGLCISSKPGSGPW